MKQAILFLISLPARSYVLASICWALFILYVLLAPGSDLPSIQIWQGDKLVHTGLFFVLTGLVWKSFVASANALPVRKANIYSVLIAVSYGIATELLQLSAAERTADIVDAIADVTGAFLFLGVVVFVDRKRRNHTTPGSAG